MLRTCVIVWTLFQAVSTTQAQAPRDWAKSAREMMKLAAKYYREEVANYGGYVYYYSDDLQQRWGEGRADRDVIFVQPPGTPSVGMAYLAAYQATGDDYYLDSARETAEALEYGQLKSGGWTQTILFIEGRKSNHRDGHSSLDDGTTQAALQLLARVDGALKFENPTIHEAALRGYDALLKAQFPIGAFPQGWTKPVEAHPVLRAKYPEYDWKTEGRIKNYWDYYTLNDGLAGTVAETLIVAYDVYKDEKYRQALARLGDFLLLAQMPEPQPGWCQQYNYEMLPIWARKFEPPAITAWEAQDVMETLIRINEVTKDPKYLAPIPRALEYYKTCILPNGMVARYYELKTNRPLYMDEKYQLSYDDSTAPKHYGWKQTQRFERIEKRYLAAKDGVYLKPSEALDDLELEVQRVLGKFDRKHRWLSVYMGERLVGQPKFPEHFHYISSDVFRKNMETLCRYVIAKSNTRAGGN